MKGRTSRYACECFLFLVFCLSLFPQAITLVGYSTFTADPGSLLPVGAALFSYANGVGLLVSQAGVAATLPIFSGRIFVDESGTQTGIALANVWRVTLYGRRVMGAALYLRDHDFPRACSTIAA